MNFTCICTCLHGNTMHLAFGISRPRSSCSCCTVSTQKIRVWQFEGVLVSTTSGSCTAAWERHQQDLCAIQKHVFLGEMYVSWCIYFNNDSYLERIRQQDATGSVGSQEASQRAAWFQAAKECSRPLGWCFESNFQAVTTCNHMQPRRNVDDQRVRVKGQLKNEAVSSYVNWVPVTA